MGNRSLAFSLLLLLLLPLPALALGTGDGAGTGPRIADFLAAPCPDTLGTLLGQGDIDTGETEGPSDDVSLGDLLPKFNAMTESVERDMKEGLYQFWAGFYMWTSPSLVAYGESSQQDMRAAEAQGVLFATHGIAIRTVDFVDELELDQKPEAFYQQAQVELGVRFENHCFRLMWWLWQDHQDSSDIINVHKDTAFGDVVYYAGHPIRFPFTMMDTKLIYEYRIIPWSRFQLFLGLALHWLYTIDWTAMFYTYWEDGYQHSSAARHSDGTAYFYDKDIDEDPQAGHYPLASISLRIDANPVAGFHIQADIQEIYVYYGNYLDARVGVFNELLMGLRIGAGYRIWAVTAMVDEVGSHLTTFHGRAVFHGFYVGAFWHF